MMDKSVIRVSIQGIRRQIKWRVNTLCHIKSFIEGRSLPYGGGVRRRYLSNINSGLRYHKEITKLRQIAADLKQIIA